MIKNIRHIQIKKIIDASNLYKAIIIYEQQNNVWTEREDIEETKLMELKKIKELKNKKEI
tara:strand:- start:2665 stop:2844 length:180 start_codon:yes stop_codon:yes gene_type:complete